MAAAQAPAHVVLDFSFNYGSAASSSAFGPNGTFQYCPVKCTANDLEVSPSSSGGVTVSASTRVIGVLQNAPGLNQAATVRMLGITKLVVDGSGTTIAPGDMLTSDATGRAVKTAATSVENFAMALQASSAASDIISAFLMPGQRF